MKKDLLRTLGIALPIIQAPMAGVSTPALAAAVSNAGGLGSLGVGATTAAGAGSMIRETQSLTDKPFNINVFCHQSAVADPTREARWLDWLAPQFSKFNATPTALRDIYRSFLDDPAMLDMLLSHRPPVVSFHFGLPSQASIAALHQKGIVLLATATNLAEAEAIVAAGVDAVVAQGMEAGGHRGAFDPHADDDFLGTLVLTRLIVRQTRVPVIATGGIMDGADIAAALALGAQAAQLGMAFVACPESSIDSAYRQAPAAAASRRTAFTPSISGRKARGLVNAFTALDGDQHRPPVPDYPRAYDAGKALDAAAKAVGVHGFGAQWAGQGAPLAGAVPAAQLMESLQLELATARQHMSSQES